MAKDARREPFEQLYERLEEHVRRLEQGGLSLDDSIALYEQGMILARECQARLEEADLKITKLKESFAPTVTANGNSALRVGGAIPADYEYVADDEHSPDEADNG